MSNLPPVAAITEDDLPRLTDAQFEYALGVLGGKTLADAYRGAYDCENWSANALYVESSRLAANPKVALWLRHWRRQGMARGTVTLEGHLAELEKLKQIGLDTGNIGASVKAEELRGKAAGVYLGDDTGRLGKIPAAQLLALVREGIGGIEGEEAAQKLAKRLGVTLLPNKALVIDHVPSEDVA